MVPTTSKKEALQAIWDINIGDGEGRGGGRGGRDGEGRGGTAQYGGQGERGSDESTRCNIHYRNTPSSLVTKKPTQL